MAKQGERAKQRVTAGAPGSTPWAAAPHGPLPTQFYLHQPRVLCYEFHRPDLKNRGMFLSCALGMLRYPRQKTRSP